MNGCHNRLNTHRKNDIPESAWDPRHGDVHYQASIIKAVSRGARKAVPTIALGAFFGSFTNECAAECDWIASDAPIRIDAIRFHARARIGTERELPGSMLLERASIAAYGQPQMRPVAG